MKSGKLAEFLEPTAALLDWGNSPHAAESVNLLFTALTKNPKQDLLVLLALSNGESADVSEGGFSLKSFLQSIAMIQRAAGAATSSKSVAKLNDAIANDVSVEQFAANVESFDLVAGFVRRLHDASGSRDQFERVMAMLETKGVVSKTQACTIAQKYAGGPKPKSLEQALNAIRSKFSSDQLFSSKTA